MEIIPLGGSGAVLTNDNWGDSANAGDLVSAAADVGAFGLENNSLDAAILTDLALPNTAGNRGYTVRISSTSDAASGVALAEVYDPQDAGVGAKLINVSALGFSGNGAGAIVPGFVIEGPGAKNILIRVVGPTIAAAPFNVPGTMADPKLTVVPLGQNYAIAENDNWSGTTALKDAFTSVGAFAFPNDSSADAAVVVRLPPGGYTVVVEGANNGTGVVLVEAYDLD
jgi:predicted RNA-binding protein with TRAM domain